MSINEDNAKTQLVAAGVQSTIDTAMTQLRTAKAAWFSPGLLADDFSSAVNCICAAAGLPPLALGGIERVDYRTSTQSAGIVNAITALQSSGFQTTLNTLLSQIRTAAAAASLSPAADDFANALNAIGKAKGLARLSNAGAY